MVNLRRTIFYLLIGFALYSIINLLTEVPLAFVFSALAIISGIVLVGKMFADTYQMKSTAGLSPAMVIINWVMSFMGITAGFASIYLELVRLTPHHFLGITDGMSATYFSVVTFATVGFGDIYPVSMLAKLLVISEIGTAIILLPAIIGTSVAQVINHRLRQQDREFINRGNEQNRIFRVK